MVLFHFLQLAVDLFQVVLPKETLLEVESQQGVQDIESERCQERDNEPNM
jgi:hypothetical protein